MLAEGEPRIVRVDGRRLDLLPAGDLLVLRNRDVPGVLGRVGTLLGEHGINIGELRLGRRADREVAVSVWQVDQVVEEPVLRALAGLAEVQEVRQVDLGAAPPRPLGGHQAKK
jgi:D-3-phosphoglycerate dehydrogenase